VGSFKIRVLFRKRVLEKFFFFIWKKPNTNERSTKFKGKLSTREVPRVPVTKVVFLTPVKSYSSTLIHLVISWLILHLEEFAHSLNNHISGVCTLWCGLPTTFSLKLWQEYLTAILNSHPTWYHSHSWCRAAIVQCTLKCSRALQSTWNKWFSSAYKH